MTWTPRPRAILAAAFTLVACTTGEASFYTTETTLEGSTGPVRVEALANAGVWIQSDETVVVIDALYEGTLSGGTYHYRNLEPDDHAAMRAGEGRWADVDLVLVTHRHFDHFDAGSVAAHMTANPEAVFAGPRQAADELLEVFGDASRVHGFRPSTDGSGELEHGAVTVRFLDLPHGGSWRGSIENVGLTVEIDGVRILHVGDAATDSDLYEAVHADVTGLDLFLAPVWFFDDRRGARVIRELVAADRVIGMHATPPRTRGFERMIERNWPDAQVFWRPMP